MGITQAVIETNVYRIETLGPVIPDSMHQNLVSGFIRVLNGYEGNDASEFVNRVNYITHVVRLSGRMHDPDAPKTLDMSHPACIAFVAKVGA